MEVASANPLWLLDVLEHKDLVDLIDKHRELYDSCCEPLFEFQYEDILFMELDKEMAALNDQLAMIQTTSRTIQDFLGGNESYQSDYTATITCMDTLSASIQEHTGELQVACNGCCRAKIALGEMLVEFYQKLEESNLECRKLLVGLIPHHQYTQAVELLRLDLHKPDDAKYGSLLALYNEYKDTEGGEEEDDDDDNNDGAETHGDSDAESDTLRGHEEDEDETVHDLKRKRASDDVEGTTRSRNST